VVIVAGLLIFGVANRMLTKC